jgi:hypothetical protein
MRSARCWPLASPVHPGTAQASPAHRCVLGPRVARPSARRELRRIVPRRKRSRRSTEQAAPGASLARSAAPPVKPARGRADLPRRQGGRAVDVNCCAGGKSRPQKAPRADTTERVKAVGNGAFLLVRTLQGRLSFGFSRPCQQRPPDGEARSRASWGSIVPLRCCISLLYLAY